MKDTAITAGSQRRGMAIITTTLTIMVLVPLVGLAIDLSMLYLIKAKLLCALDAAALAGARALSEGATPAAQAQNARNAASKFFYANFPTSYWGTTNLNFSSPSVDDTSVPNYRTITSWASVQAPLYFLRVFGSDHSTVAIGAQAARRDALVMLVLDRSSSMTRTVPGTGQSACEIMKQDATEFVANFAPGRDQLGLVVFGASAFTYQSRTDFTTADAQGNTVPSLINQISCYGNTGSAQALNAAYAELLRVNNRNRVNVIVFMTDGLPNGVTADFFNYRSHPTTCDAAGRRPLAGTLAQWANNAPTGDTAGLMQSNGTGVASPNPEVAASVNSAGCQFVANLKNVRNDFSRMPDTDIFGSTLAGSYSVYNMNPPYNGTNANLNRLDLPQEITKASANALDNQATTVRSNAVLKPLIYTIGLTNYDPSAPNDVPDELLLKKIANDSSLAQDPAPAPTFYSNQQNQTKGIYVVAPDATQLQAAFDTVATHIVVRLSQ